MLYFAFLDVVHIFIRCLKQPCKVCGDGTSGDIQGGRTTADRDVIGLVTQFIKMFQILFDLDEKLLGASAASLGRIQ